MHTWYDAVCNTCKEHADVMVMFNGRDKTSVFVDPYKLGDFLSKHYGCELWLSWRDDQLDRYIDSHKEVDTAAKHDNKERLP